MRVELANGAAQTNPGTARQPVVQEVKVEVALPSKAQPIVEVAGEAELIFCEGELHNLPSVFVVFDKKDSLFLSVEAHHTITCSCSGVFFTILHLHSKSRKSAR